MCGDRPTIRLERGLRSQGPGGVLMARRRFGNRLHDCFTIVLFALGVVAMGSRSAAAEVEYVLENYNYLLTYQDCGFNQFGGNTGGFNSDNLPEFAVCDKGVGTHRFVEDSADGPGRALRLAFDFPPEAAFLASFTRSPTSPRPEGRSIGANSRNSSSKSSASGLGLRTLRTLTFSSTASRSSTATARPISSLGWATGTSSA